MATDPLFSRRRFLSGCGTLGLGTMAGLPLSFSLALPMRGAETRTSLPGETGRIYISGQGEKAGGQFHVSAFSLEQESYHPLFTLPLPGRGHAAAISPDKGQAVLFARRPGGFAVVIDLARQSISKIPVITAREERHFYGHGVYSADGTRLYASENDFTTGRGIIGIYDTTRHYQRLGELPSHGIDPHEMLLLSDGETLAIANGGILTHPDAPRAKLNLDTMAPSLVYIDRRSGRLLEKATLPPAFHQASIRHLARGNEDRVAMVMQYEGPPDQVVPLVALHRRGTAPVLATSPAPVLARMRQYCGSAAFDASGEVLAVSSPRGNVITFWRGNDLGHLASAVVADGCGIAADGTSGGFIATSGLGGVWRLDGRTGESRPLPPQAQGGGDGARAMWDNHLINL